jgi:hypothetical protein
MQAAMGQKLSIAFGSQQGRVQGVLYPQAKVVRARVHFGLGAVVLLGIANHAAFADLAFSYFKLWLD